MFGMKIDNDLLHCGIENQLSSIYSSIYLSISQLYKIESSYLVYRITMTHCIMG